MAWREAFFCEFEDCGKVAVLALKAHRLDEPLLGGTLHYVCKAHWYEPVRDVVNLMIRDEDIKGLSIVLP